MFELAESRYLVGKPFKRHPVAASPHHVFDLRSVRGQQLYDEAFSCRERISSRSHHSTMADLVESRNRGPMSDRSARHLVQRERYVRQKCLLDSPL
jgi:hypothetical protein